MTTFACSFGTKINKYTLKTNAVCANYGHEQQLSLDNLSFVCNLFNVKAFIISFTQDTGCNSTKLWKSSELDNWTLSVSSF